MPRREPPAFWPPENPKRIAVVAALTMFVVGLVVILVEDASGAHLGTLLIGCVALGTILASFLDRRRAPR